MASTETTKPAAVETQAPPAEAKKEVVAAPEVKPVEPMPVASAEAPASKPAAAPEPVPVAKPAPAPAPVAAAKPAAEPAPAAEAPKPVLKIPTDPNTFLITASTKTHQHPNYGRGKEIGFNVNGVPGRDIVVTRGQTYKFVVDTGVQHDFYLTTSPAGWGAGTYTDGVTGQFIYKGAVTFKPTSKTPDLLYYECRNHKYMGGKIYVLDKGEDLAKVKAAVDAKVDEGVSRQRKIQVSESSVKQKLSYAQMVLGSSSAKRVEASGNSHAIGVLNNARSKIGAAKASLGAGQLETAMQQVNEGLRLVTAASREITSESEMSGVDYKARYGELTKSLQNYDKSYQRHIKRAKKPLKSKLDEAAYRRLVKEGHALAGKEDYAGASKSLEKAQSMITSVLTDMLHAQTVTYDKKFETPKEEYEYELARLESYDELIPIAIEQKQPSARAIELINSFVKKADKIKGEGQDVAAKGDYKMAIMAMQAATSNLQRALRMAGVH